MQSFAKTTDIYLQITSPGLINIRLIATSTN